jgi:GDP-mannose 4,6-dehydratase
MRVLVTGGSGFIGSHIVPRLLEAHEVYCLERYVTGRYVLGLPSQAYKVYGDIRDASKVSRLVAEVQPDACIHLAAISPVSYSYSHPQEVTETNLMGTVNLAEACLRVPHFRHFLFASTSETYGNGPNPKTEETPQNPNSPYAVAKLAAEKYLLYMRDAYGFPVTILRPFNTYGRKRNKHFVVERIVTQMLLGGTIRLGDPAPVRDLMYVEDHVNAYLTCLGNSKAVGEAFNFCTGVAVSIKKLVETIQDLTEFRGMVEWGTIPRRPLDIQVLIGSNEKARRILGWTPKYSLEAGLQETIEYWRKRLTLEPPPTTLREVVA